MGILYSSECKVFFKCSYRNTNLLIEIKRKTSWCQQCEPENSLHLVQLEVGLLSEKDYLILSAVSALTMARKSRSNSVDRILVEDYEFVKQAKDYEARKNSFPMILINQDGENQMQECCCYHKEFYFKIYHKIKSNKVL